MTYRKPIVYVQSLKNKILEHLLAHICISKAYIYRYHIFQICTYHINTVFMCCMYKKRKYRYRCHLSIYVVYISTSKIIYIIYANMSHLYIHAIKVEIKPRNVSDPWLIRDRHFCI